MRTSLSGLDSRPELQLEISSVSFNREFLETSVMPEFMHGVGDSLRGVFLSVVIELVGELLPVTS